MAKGGCFAGVQAGFECVGWCLQGVWREGAGVRREKGDGPQIGAGATEEPDPRHPAF